MKNKERFDFDLNLLGSNDFIIGIDEVGWGCVAGDLVLGGACVPKSIYESSHPPSFLQEVKDSKKLSEIKRIKLIDSINNQTEILTAIGSCPVSVINEKGLAYAYTECIHQILTQFDDKLLSSKILIDGSRDPKLKSKIDFELIVKGDDKSLVIGIASNMAKQFRDDLMISLDKEYPGYDFANNMGYGTPNHKVALLNNNLTAIHRIDPSLKLIGRSK